LDTGIYWFIHKHRVFINVNQPLQLHAINTSLPLELSPLVMDTDEFKISPRFEKVIEDFDKKLRRSVESRTLNIPAPSDLCQSRLGILFSGGIDCTTLAALAHDFIPRDEPIDLLNVAFENPRSAERERDYEVPDRITGRKSWHQLMAQAPQRTWRFIEINVPYKEYLETKPRILKLMKPSNSVMDLVIFFGFKSFPNLP
jgi:asparagine synthetase B (glutamine-hydrolysing)